MKSNPRNHNTGRAEPGSRSWREASSLSAPRAKSRGERLRTAAARGAPSACLPRRGSRGRSRWRRKGRRSRQTALEEEGDSGWKQRHCLNEGDYLTVTTEKCLQAPAMVPTAQRVVSSPLSPQQQQNQLLQPVAISRLPTCCTARTGTRMESGLSAQAL